MTFREHLQRTILETIEALLTFLTIENNNLNIQSDSSKESDRGQHCNVWGKFGFLRKFWIFRKEFGPSEKIDFRENLGFLYELFWVSC